MGIYQSFYHKLGYKGKPPVDENGVEIKPIGYNVNKANVFSVDMVNGEPVLHITGEIYGCVFTKQEFENYHIKLNTSGALRSGCRALMSQKIRAYYIIHKGNAVLNTGAAGC
jgi:hypothetical protein